MKCDYYPTMYWNEQGTIHRAFYEYEEYAENPRDWDYSLSTIVNASKYGLCGSSDEEVKDIEDWLIAETGINEDWYENNYKRYGGVDGLIQKFIKEKCIAFEYLSVYDHSGITVSCGKSYGWDCSNIGFVYVAKDNPEVIEYRKTHSKKETEEWALGILHSEIKLLDDWCTGSVYCLVEESFNTETEEWEFNDSLGCMYLNEYEDAISEIKNNFSAGCQLLNEKEFNKLFTNKVLDTLNGQKLFEFMEIA